LDEAQNAERDLRDHLADIADYEQQRKQAVNDSTPRRREFQTATAQLDAALDRTRPQRVHALMCDASPDLIKHLGEPPASAAGRAVWCHHALPIEAALDRNDGVSPPQTGWSQHDDRARQEIAVADRLLEAKSAVTNPTQWAELAQQARTIREQALRDLRVRRAYHETVTPNHQAEHQLSIDRSRRPGGPEIGL
jgi:hypothetical protein